MVKNDYGKDWVKIKFNSDNDFPLNKPLKFHAMTIIIRSVFEEGFVVFCVLWYYSSSYIGKNLL